MTPFTGIPTDAVEFYRELQFDNTRSWWATNRDRYAASVRGPVEGLLGELADEFGEGVAYRPHRDVRFSADRTPLKDHQGALVHVVDGLGFYVQVGPEGLTTGAGYLPKGPDQLVRLRAAVDATATGQELERIVRELRTAGFELQGETLKTRPRGVAEDHPRLELMRLKNIVATRRHGEVPWMSTPEVADRVRDDWRNLRALVTWLTTNVGASTAGRDPRGR